MDFIDGAESSSRSTNLVDNCSGNSCALSEYSCEKSKTFLESVVSSKYYHCKNGCKDGACIKDSNDISTQKEPVSATDNIKCTDFDCFNDIEKKCESNSRGNLKTKSEDFDFYIISETASGCNFTITVNNFLNMSNLKNKQITCLNPYFTASQYGDLKDFTLADNGCQGDFMDTFNNNYFYNYYEGINRPILIKVKSDCSGINCFNDKINKCEKGTVDLIESIPDDAQSKGDSFGDWRSYSNLSYNNHNIIKHSLIIIGKNNFGCFVKTKMTIEGAISDKNAFKKLFKEDYPEKYINKTFYLLVNKDSKLDSFADGHVTNSNYISDVIYNELSLKPKIDLKFTKNYTGDVLFEKENNSLWYVGNTIQKRYLINENSNGFLQYLSADKGKYEFINTKNFNKYKKTSFPLKYKKNIIGVGELDNSSYGLDFYYVNKNGKTVSLGNFYTGLTNFSNVYNDSKKAATTLSSKNILKIQIAY